MLMIKSEKNVVSFWKKKSKNNFTLEEFTRCGITIEVGTDAYPGIKPNTTKGLEKEIFLVSTIDNRCADKQQMTRRIGKVANHQ